MNASIIIPVYKRTSWIGTCINKIRAQDYAGRYEVILVDDGSPNEDEVRKACEACIAGDKRIRFIRNSHGGPAAARNAGVKASSGSILCFLDDDSVPELSWLAEIVQPFSADPGTGLVNGRTRSIGRTGMPLLLEQSVYPEKSWATCNIAYRRDAFEALGGFDEQFREPSWEDNELGLRARWGGFRHAYAPHAVVCHPHEQTMDEYRNKCLLNGRGIAAFSSKYARTKRAWAILAPLLMSRKLVYGLLPWIWIRKETSPLYLKFCWSFFSLQGFIQGIRRS